MIFTIKNIFSVGRWFYKVKKKKRNIRARKNTLGMSIINFCYQPKRKRKENENCGNGIFFRMIIIYLLCASIKITKKMFILEILLLFIIACIVFVKSKKKKPHRYRSVFFKLLFLIIICRYIYIFKLLSNNVIFIYQMTQKSVWFLVHKLTSQS